MMDFMSLRKYELKEILFGDSRGLLNLSRDLCQILIARSLDRQIGSVHAPTNRISLRPNNVFNIKFVRNLL